MSDSPLTDALQDEHRADISCAIIYDHARRMERDRARLIECCRSFVKAASKDIVEDFSAVSNAADSAHDLLRELDSPR